MRENKTQTQAGLVVVESPSYGIFYTQPEPGAPKYVEVGSRVEEGDTIGLIEIMKVFSAITADVAGEVVEIYAENEGTLEPGQALVAIKVD